MNEDLKTQIFDEEGAVRRPVENTALNRVMIRMETEGTPIKLSPQGVIFLREGENADT